MKRSALAFLFILLFVPLLTVTAFADMGPKDQLVIRLENAPSAPYYLDLLAEGPAENLHVYLTDDEKTQLDADLLAALIAAVPDGWHACVAQGVTGAPIFGDLTANRDDNTHFFGYLGVPDTYRILIACADGETWVSAPITRTVLQSSVTLDWVTREITVPPTWVGYLLQFLATFVPTILLEGLLLIFFRLADRRGWLVFLLVNLITQGALAVWCSVTFLQDGFQGILSIPGFILFEIVILIVESVLYRRLLKLDGAPAPHTTRYAVCANLTSAVVGWFLAEPVWRFVVSIS